MLPELLDSLPADAPEAVRSRGDLRLINHIMGNYRWLLQRLRKETGEITELGAGDGLLGRYETCLPGRKVTGLDLAGRPSLWPEGWDWKQGDLFAEWQKPQGTVVANLFLHHFEEPELEQIGERIRRGQVSRLFAVEPSRRRKHLRQGRLLDLLGIGEVTRHDLAISVRAGFLPGELGEALGFSPEDWEIHEETSFFGGLRFDAVRR